MTSLNRVLWIFLTYFCRITQGQLCSSVNGLGKCSSNVFTCIFQNGYPQYFASKEAAGECSTEEFCCVSLPRPEDGSCNNRCGIPGSSRNKPSDTSNKINLDSKYNWTSLMPNPQAQERSSRIINGTDVDKYEFCWQGAVFVVDTNQLQNNSRNAIPIYIGGASLVAQDMALTAAHVLQPFITNANFIIFVAFGFRSISAVTDVMNGSVNFDELPSMRVPNEMAFHSAYNDRTYENNIAIIRFNPISCANGNICPICLSPTPANPFQPWKGTCYASGWGATASSSVATTLQKLEMVIPYPNECLKSFQKLGLKNYDLPSTMLCADAAPGLSGGTCDRDGGSPLICQTKYGNYELTGIVGVGINRCRQIQAPTLFTNVGYYYEWIQSYSEGSYREPEFPTTNKQVQLGTSTENPNYTSEIWSDTIIDNSSDSSFESSTTLSSVTLLSEDSLSSTSETQSDSTSETLVSTTPQTTTAKPRPKLATRPRPVAPRNYTRATRQRPIFQFATPKIFVPNNKVTLSAQKKLAQAFFQERNDFEDQRATTSKPDGNTFSIFLDSPNRFSGNSISDNSGSIKFFMKAGDTLIKRKPPAENTFVDPEDLTTLEPLTLPTTSTTLPTTTSTTTTTATTSTSTSTTTTEVTTEQATLKPDPIQVFLDEAKQRTTTTESSNVVTQSGFSKIYIKIRPQDNSILSYLRRRYKDSQRYTELHPSTLSDISEATNQRITTTSSTKKPVLFTKYLMTFSQDATPETTATFPKLRTEWFTRPTGPSVMMR